MRNENVEQVPDLSVFWKKLYFAEDGTSIKTAGPFFNLNAFRNYFGDEAGDRLEEYFKLLERYGGRVPESEKAAIQAIETAFQTHAGFAIHEVYAAKGKA